MMDLILPAELSESLLSSFVSSARYLGVSSLAVALSVPDRRRADFAKELLSSFSFPLVPVQIVAPATRKLFFQRRIMISPENPRAAFEKAPVSAVFNLEFMPLRDFIHHRASGLNHIIAGIASRKNKSAGLFFSSLLSLSDSRLASVLGRARQNAALCRKAGIRYAIVSGASLPVHLRSRVELASFARTLGLDSSCVGLDF